MNQGKLKSIATRIPAPRGHWVGDGFPVRSMFGELSFTPSISPFLMMDYAGPATFTPTEERRGVDGHPHKGFETVTIVYAGEVEHRDSVGHHGVIGPGDVQWMTAASGILHEEFHSRDFARRGGLFEMVQLWVNLPARDKAAAPRYQSILNASIPVVTLPNDSGTIRIIAGSHDGHKGPAETFTPINLWDIRLKAGKTVSLTVPEGYMTAVFVLKGSVTVCGDVPMGNAEMAILNTAGDLVSIDAKEDSTILLLNGEIIHEPIAAQGPFVMNTKGELRQAMIDFQSGKMGSLPE